MFIGSMLVVLLIPLILFLAVGVPILIGILVYRDANKRIDCSPWLWALVAALVPSFIGAVIYLIIRRDYPLKPEYRAQKNWQYQSGQHDTYQTATGTENGGQENRYNSADQWQEQGMERTGLPAWGKALVIIGIVIIAICLIALVVSIVKYIFGYSAIHSGYHYGF